MGGVSCVSYIPPSGDYRVVGCIFPRDSEGCAKVDDEQVQDSDDAAPDSDVHSSESPLDEPPIEAYDDAEQYYDEGVWDSEYQTGEVATDVTDEDGQQEIETAVATDSEGSLPSIVESEEDDRDVPVYKGDMSDDDLEDAVWQVKVVDPGSTGLRVMLNDMGLSIRHNNRTDKIEVKYDPENDASPHVGYGTEDYEAWKKMGMLSQDPDGWMSLSGGWDHMIRDRAPRTHRLRKSHTGRDPSTYAWKMTPVDWKDAVSAAARVNAVDPFIEWVEQLPAWDGIPRVLTLLRDLLGAPDDDYSLWASRVPFVGALARAYKPGEALDEIPVLIGPQRIGKSRYFRHMLPTSTWYTSFHLSGDTKKLIENTKGKVIVEWEEMTGHRTVDSAAVKALLSSESDHDRVAYAAEATTVLRRFVIVSTCNRDVHLPADPTGTRRYVCIDCKGVSTGAWVQEQMKSQREQLWAEARDRRNSGDPLFTDPRLPAKLEEGQEALNEPWKSIDETLADRIAELPYDEMTMTQIAKSVDLMVKGHNEEYKPITRADTYRLAAALQTAGWERSPKAKYKDGKNQRFWMSPRLLAQEHAD